MWRAFLAFLTIVVAVPLSRADAPPPVSIVFILADDLGYGDLGCYGCPDIRTLAVDKLASQGARFTSYYTNGAECTPTRTALMTGRYQHRVGGLECAIGLGNVGRYDDAIRLAGQHDLGLPVSETSIATMLKKAGYTTALFGKWHLGYEAKFLPDKHGFDQSFGPVGGAVDYFLHNEPGGKSLLYQNGKLVERDGYLTDLITDEAVNFLKAQKGKPFFLYVPYTAPHNPLQGPSDRPEKPLTEKEFNRGGSRAAYVALVEHMDKVIGQILKTLEETGDAGRTVVFFSSDNGGTRDARNSPLSGNKGGLFEGGIRVPCIARWPGVLKPGTVSEQPMITMDLSASIVRIAGAAPAQDRPLDGMDVLKKLTENRPVVKRTLFWRQRRGDTTWKAVRDGSLKYISHKSGDKVDEYLFDLARDPSEKMNLFAAQADDVQRLKRLVAEWEKEVKHNR